MDIFVNLGIALVATLIGVILGYRLHKQITDREQKRAVTATLVDSARKLLPHIETRLEQRCLFPVEIGPLRKVISDSKTQSSYLNLPKNTKVLIDDLIAALDSFSRSFLELKNDLYPFLQSLDKTRAANATEEVLATWLATIDEQDVPDTPLKVSFPKDDPSVFSVASLSAEQVRDLWKLGSNLSA